MTETPAPRRQLRVVAGAALGLALVVLAGIRMGYDGEPADVATPTTAPLDLVKDRPVTRPRAQDGRNLRFTSVTSASGIDRWAATGELEGSAGVVVADLDGDRKPDVYLTNIGRPNVFLHNDGDGTFTDHTAQTGLGGLDPSNGYLSAVAADFRGVGCPDVYLAAARRGTNVLYLNDCKGHFTPAADDRGLTLPARPDSPFGNAENAMAVADYDRDGDLDLVVGSWFVPEQKIEGLPGLAPAEASSVCAGQNRKRGGWFDDPPATASNRSRLFRNDGEGRFTDVTVEAGLPLDRIAVVAVRFADLDEDGWQDLMFAGDLCTSRFFHNDHGRGFVDRTDRAGLGYGQSDMGSVVADFDGDGRPDWFVTDISRLDGTCGPVVHEHDCAGNHLYLNRGDGRFADRTSGEGVRHGWFGWGATAADLGNDGRLAIAQVSAFSAPFLEQIGVPKDETEEYKDFQGKAMRLWVPTPRGRTDVAKLAGLGKVLDGQSLVAFDMDDDGDLDLLQRGLDGRTQLLRNDGAKSAAVSLALDDPSHAGNRAGIGARVAVTVPGRKTPVVQWVTADGSFASQVPPVVHVGLGDRDAATRVQVWWPGCDRPQTWSHVRSGSHVLVRRDGPC